MTRLSSTLMVSSTLVLAVAALISASCSTFSGPTVVGSGRAATDQRDVGDFSRVRVTTGIAATVIVGPDSSVTVTADDNLLVNVSTSVVAGRLTVEVQGNSLPKTPVSV